MEELFAKLAASAVLTGLIELGVYMFDGVLEWWIAVLISLAFIFGGFLILDMDGDWV